MAKLTFSENGWSDYLYWQSEDIRMLKKINKLIKVAQRTPFKGEGKPEPLGKIGPNIWSRRINKKDRLVYEVNDDGIAILQCKGHYNDK